MFKLQISSIFNFDWAYQSWIGGVLGVKKSLNVYYVVLEMSSSWNFPAPASPSCESSKPSQAELGHFHFRAETELTICMSKSLKFFKLIFPQVFIIRSPVSWFQPWFQSILLSFIWTFVFLKVKIWFRFII